MCKEARAFVAFTAVVVADSPTQSSSVREKVRLVGRDCFEATRRRRGRGVAREGPIDWKESDNGEISKSRVRARLKM